MKAESLQWLTLNHASYSANHRPSQDQTSYVILVLVTGLVACCQYRCWSGTAVFLWQRSRGLGAIKTFGLPFGLRDKLQAFFDPAGCDRVYLPLLLPCRRAACRERSCQVFHFLHPSCWLQNPTAAANGTDRHAFRVYPSSEKQNCSFKGVTDPKKRLQHCGASWARTQAAVLPALIPT